MQTSLILAIESSCDETSAAVIENGNRICSNIVASQVRSHMRFGGVVPEVASRHHVEQITQVLNLALEEASVSMEDIDAVAVTQGPGLVGALLVGVTAAKALAMVHQKPLLGVNHLAGHIYASQLVKELKFPLMTLIVSGGHTELVYMKEDYDFRVIGQTHDDAVGEAYDKVGRMLDLPYPAGKYLDELAATGDPLAYDIPRAMLHEDNYDFSFSGMKSAVMNIVHNAKQRGDTVIPENLAASFQEAAVEVLVEKTVRALREHPEIRQLILAGGVAANSSLRTTLRARLDEEFPDIVFIIPPLNLCGDNAAMIGAAAHHQYIKGQFDPLDINALPGLALK